MDSCGVDAADCGTGAVGGVGTDARFSQRSLDVADRKASPRGPYVNAGLWALPSVPQVSIRTAAARVPAA